MKTLRYSTKANEEEMPGRDMPVPPQVPPSRLQEREFEKPPAEPRQEVAEPQRVEAPEEETEQVTPHIRQPRHLGEHTRQVYPTLGEGVIRVLQWYVNASGTEHTSQTLNAAMRTAGGDVSKLTDPELVRRARALGEALDRAPPLKKPVTVYRGLGDLDPETMDGLLKTLAPGSVVTFPQFLSTSLDQQTVIDTFTDPVDRENASLLFEIKALNGLRLDNSLLKGEGDEGELLKSPKNRYRVATRGLKEYGGRAYHTVYLEELP